MLAALRMLFTVFAKECQQLQCQEDWSMFHV